MLLAARMAISGIEAFLCLLSSSSRYIFGNPGTTELPLNDALVSSPNDFRYILGLQEVPLVAMADGYAMASGQLGVVNLHTCCGLGNAMGMIYNAYREGTPLLITAGQQDRRLSFSEPILWGNMVDVVRPWTKYAVEVQRVEDLVSATRRAIQAALTPPRGPVFMSLPLDVQMAMLEELEPIEEPLDFGIPDHRVRPPIAALEMAADTLCNAAESRDFGRQPRARSGCGERFGAIGGEDSVRRSFPKAARRMAGWRFPCDHPLYAQGLPLWAPEIYQRLKEFDVLLVVGMDLLREYVYHEPARAIPEHIKLIHLDEDPYQLGKNYRLEEGLIGETKTGIIELDATLAKAHDARAE